MKVSVPVMTVRDESTTPSLSVSLKIKQSSGHDNDSGIPATGEIASGTGPPCMITTCQQVSRMASLEQVSTSSPILSTQIVIVSSVLYLIPWVIIIESPAHETIPESGDVNVCVIASGPVIVTVGERVSGPVKSGNSRTISGDIVSAPESGGSWLMNSGGILSKVKLNTWSSIGLPSPSVPSKYISIKSSFVNGSSGQKVKVSPAVRENTDPMP